MPSFSFLLFLITITFSFPTMSQNTTTDYSFYDININDISGKKIDLVNFKGKKILVVNVASECGFTKQYEALQELYEKYNDKLIIIGVPCNQFGGQEPGSSSEIQSFCKLNFGVTFLLTEKINVKGKEQHQLYNWLTKKALNRMKNSTVKWNFQKYLINENGEFIDYFYSITKPDSKKITKLL